jgi:hypothetical protein
MNFINNVDWTPNFQISKIGVDFFQLASGNLT